MNLAQYDYIASQSEALDIRTVKIFKQLICYQQFMQNLSAMHVEYIFRICYSRDIPFV
uniref:Uncharacterized protein n=1 Tax=Arundo donax TaxID=35708 RepID=A0A0A9H2B9_ARUDO